MSDESTTLDDAAAPDLVESPAVVDPEGCAEEHAASARTILKRTAIRLIIHAPRTRYHRKMYPSPLASKTIDDRSVVLVRRRSVMSVTVRMPKEMEVCQLSSC
jgi:hypothetical protein